MQMHIYKYVDIHSLMNGICNESLKLLISPLIYVYYTIQVYQETA